MTIEQKHAAQDILATLISFDCRGINCYDCPFSDSNGSCMVTTARAKFDELNKSMVTMFHGHADTDSIKYGIPPVKKSAPATTGFDIKTLYEQTTMYCDLIAKSSDHQYNIDIYQQPNTPIKVFVYWSKELHKITSINYTIKGE